MVPNEWLHFIDSLWNHLNITTDLASTPQTHLHALLELLTILPEEVTRADIPQDQKSKVSAELCDGFPRILELLELCMGSHASSTKLVALQCLQSWIAFEIPVPMLPPIIAKTLELLASGDAEVFEPAIEVLHELVTHPKSGQYEASICDGVLVEVTTGSVRRYFDANFEGELIGTYTRSATELNALQNYRRVHCTRCMSITRCIW